MTAARRFVSNDPLDGLAQTGAPPASAGAGEIAPGVVRLATPASQKTSVGLAGPGEVLVRVGEASVLGSDVGGQDYPAIKRGSDVDADVFAEEPARLAWVGRLICLLTATSVSATLVWALAG